MPLSKTITAPNGIVLAFHKVTGIEIASDLSTAVITVSSWATEDDYLSSKGLAWQSREAVPLAAGIVDGIISPLLTDGPFAGASEVPDGLDTLEAAKVRKWAGIKLQRDAVEYGGFIWDGCHFDADAVSRDRIQSTVILAIIAKMAGQPFSEDWTLSDDTVRTLSADDMLGVAVAFGQQVSPAFEIARQLRDQIDAATTVEQVEAVAWPS